MKDDNYLDVFDSQDRAIDHAIWLNFKYRIAQITFGVIPHPNRKWAVCEEDAANELGAEFLDILPKDYSELSYRKLDTIRQDEDPLAYWESIIGMVTTMDGEVLRYVLKNRIPLDRIIRHELALRGFDKNHRWCGFDKAREIWLNEI